MKSLSLLVPVYAASVSAQLAGVTWLKPEIRPATAKRTITKMGPYTIPAASAGKGRDTTSWGSAFFGQVTKGLCNNNGKDPVQDCTVLAGRVGVMWADGTDRIGDPSNGLYIHHILSTDLNKKETPWFSACGNRNRASGNVNGLTGGTGFLSTGEDSAAENAMWTDPQGTVWDTGYHVKANDKFNYWAQIVNYNKVPAKVYVTFDTTWLPGTVGQNTKTIVVSATCGAGRIKMSEAGSTNTTSGKFSIMEDGRIMGGRGHIHDGGVAMHMFINDKYTCSSNAVYGTRNEAAGMEGMSHGHGGGSGGAKSMRKRQAGQSPKTAKAPAPKTTSPEILTVASMSDCTGPFKVRKGDTVVLKAEYDLKKHPLRVSVGGAKQADVMGMMGILFSPGTAPMKLLNGTILN